MIYQIISHTPTWVFALFFAMIYFGFQQTRVRTVTIRRMVILPIAMLGLSFSGVWSTFNQSSNAVTCWAIGLTMGALICLALINVREVRYFAENQTLQIPGSWLPLFLMMAIFVTKYAVGISLAHNHALVDSSSFVVVVSFFYGLWSGMFAGRTLKIVGTQSHQFISQMSNG